jgi:uncharacterized protein (TIGR00297 family)
MRYTRIHAATEVRRQTAGKETTLADSRTFSAADFIGLLAAAALIAIYSLGHAHELLAQRQNLWLSLGITVAFALLAWLARGVNWSGALAGSAIAFVLASRDLRMFWALLLVFVLTFAATLIGRNRKQQLRIAESLRGRSASQVMANLGIAGVIVAIAPQAWALLALAALAEAAADTSSSEIGMAFPGKTVLLTSWRLVSPGVDGGVSLRGTLAAVAAAAAISAAAALMKLLGGSHALAIVYAGVLGSLVDSLIGALLERRGFLNNDLVNLLSTAAAVGIARALV